MPQVIDMSCQHNHHCGPRNLALYQETPASAKYILQHELLLGAGSRPTVCKVVLCNVYCCSDVTECCGLLLVDVDHEMYAGAEFVQVAIGWC